MPPPAAKKKKLPLGCELRESRDTHNACNANSKPPTWVRHPPAGSV